MEPVSNKESAPDEIAAKQSNRSVSGQKRSRDYVDELKGLTPEPEDEAKSQPSLKKVKTAARNDEDDDDEDEDEGGQSEGLDDGEIVESIPDPETAVSAIHDTADDDVQLIDPQPQPSVPSPAEHAPDDEQHVAEEENPPAAHAPFAGWNHGISIGVRTSFGSKPVIDLKKKSNVASANPPPSATPASAAPGQVLEGEIAEEDSSDGSDADMEDDVDHGDDADDAAEDDPVEKAAAQNAVSMMTPTAVAAFVEKQHKKKSTLQIKHNDNTWILPIDSFSQIEWGPQLHRPDFWKRYFDRELEHFIRMLLNANTAIPSDSLRDVVRAAYVSFLVPKRFTKGFAKGPGKQPKRTVKGVKQIRKGVALPVLRKMSAAVFDEAVRRAMDPARSQMTDAVDEEPALHASTSAENPTFNAMNEEPASNEPALTNDQMPDVEDEEPALNGDSTENGASSSLYFPGLENTVHCTNCAGTTHYTQDCPQLACEFCGSKSHSRFGCPTKQRCSKCRQMGHGAETCQEKLALAREEVPPCVFCGADHIEDECSEIWRSFNPGNMASIKKVKEIPTFCSTCGTAGHYGSECGLRDGRLPFSKTWTQATRDFYIDPNSPSVAIGWIDVDMSQSNRQSNFHIRGRATRETHVHFVSSDDSEDDFLSAAVKKEMPPRFGGIKVSASHIAKPPKTPKSSDKIRVRNRRKNGPKDAVGGVHDHSSASYAPPAPPPQAMAHPPPPPYHCNNGGQQWQPPLPPGPPPPGMPAPIFSGYMPPQGPPPSFAPPQRSGHSSSQQRRSRGRWPKKTRRGGD